MRAGRTCRCDGFPGVSVGGFCGPVPRSHPSSPRPSGASSKGESPMRRVLRRFLVVVVPGKLIGVLSSRSRPRGSAHAGPRRRRTGSAPGRAVLPGLRCAHNVPGLQPVHSPRDHCAGRHENVAYHRARASHRDQPGDWEVRLVQHQWTRHPRLQPGWIVQRRRSGPNLLWTA